MAVAQLAWAATVVTRLTRRVLVVGVALHSSAAVVWLASRTTGLPVGPEHWHREGVGVLDVVSTVVELALAGVALSLLADWRRRGKAESGPVRRTVRRVWNWLPQGGVLPEDVWAQRHRAILVLLWVHLPALMLFGLARRLGLVELLVQGLIIAVMAVAASTVHQRRLATVLTALGLLTCSAVLVHISGGVIEMHFHYFVMVGVITLYQDWWPFLIAIGYVVLQHGLAGAIDPSAVYNHQRRSTIRGSGPASTGCSYSA